MNWPERFLTHRLAEELLWLRLRIDPQATEADALAVLRDHCGFAALGCVYAQSAYCVFDCPFNDAFQEVPYA